MLFLVLFLLCPVIEAIIAERTRLKREFMISTTKGDLPIYVVGSAFYSSLSSEDNEEFSIPEANLKSTPSVENIDELYHLLNTMQYWGVTTWPGGLISFLSRVHSSSYQEEVMKALVRFEALRELMPMYSALQNLVTKSKRSFADRTSVKMVIPLLYCENEEVVGLSAALLGNVAVFCSGNRDCVFGSIDFSRLLGRMRTITEVVTLRELSILFSKLSGLPARSLYIVQPLLPLLTYLLLAQSDETIVTHTCKALGSICDNNLDCIEEVMEMGVAPRVMELVESDSESISSAALFLGTLKPSLHSYSIQMHPLLFVLYILTVGTLTSQGNQAKQLFLDLNLLPVLLSLATHTSKCSYVAWIVHNIAAGSEARLQALYDAGLVTVVVNMLQSADETVQAQATRAVSLIIQSSSTEQIVTLVEANIVPMLCTIYGQKECSLSDMNDLRIILYRIQFHDAEMHRLCIAQILDMCGPETLKRVTHWSAY